MAKLISVRLNSASGKSLVSILIVVIAVLAIFPTQRVNGTPQVNLDVEPLVVYPGAQVLFSWYMEDRSLDHRVRVEFIISDPDGNELEHTTYGWEGVGTESNPIVETWEVPSDAIPGTYRVIVEFYGAFQEPLLLLADDQALFSILHEVSTYLIASPLSVNPTEIVTISWWIENAHIRYPERIVEINFNIFDPDGNELEHTTYGWEGVGTESNPIVETWEVPSDAIPGTYSGRIKFGAGMEPTTIELINQESVLFSVGAPPPPEFDFDLSVRPLDLVQGMRIDVSDLLSGSVSRIDRDFAEVTITLTTGDPQDLDLTCISEQSSPGLDITITPASGSPSPTFTARMKAVMTGRLSLGSYHLIITASNTLAKSISCDLLLYEGPSISVFSPINGWAGVPVTISGENLGGGQIFLGNIPVGFTDTSTTGTFVIPQNMPHDGMPITVKTPLGECTSLDELEVFPVPDYCLNWGFSFHNPSQGFLSYPQLPWNEGRYRDTFGTSQVYWDLFGVPIAPDPLAELYYWAGYWHLARSGECFGMSAASLLLFNRYEIGLLGDTQTLTPRFLDSSASVVNELAHQGNLDRLIDYMHGAQVSLECLLEYLESGALGVRHVLAEVREAVESRQYGIISVIHGFSGHAMVPYLVEDVDDLHTRIYVYDSNREEFSTERTALIACRLPNGHPPYIEIDKTGYGALNLWRWSFEHADGEIWEGWWGGNPLFFVSYNTILDRTLPVSWEGLLQYVIGDAGVRIENNEGNSLGIDEKENMLMEIPEAIAIPSPEVGGYALPFADYTSHIMGQADGIYNWYAFRGGLSAFAIEEAQVTADTKDTIKLSFQTGDPLSGGISFSTSDTAKGYSVKLIKKLTEAQRVYQIKSTDISQGSWARFETSSDLNSLTYINDGPETITYDVEFQTTMIPDEVAGQWSLAELPTTIRTSIIIGPYEKHIITPESWRYLNQSTINLEIIKLSKPTPEVYRIPIVGNIIRGLDLLTPGYGAIIFIIIIAVVAVGVIFIVRKYYRRNLRTNVSP